MPNRLLFADDSATMHHVVALTLASHDVEIHAARTMAEALALAQKQPFDTALIDAGLSGDKGYALCAQLRALENQSQLAVGLLVRATHHLDVKRMRGVGASTHLTRPFEGHALIACVTELFAQAGRARSAEAFGEGPTPDSGSASPPHAELKVLPGFEPSSTAPLDADLQQTLEMDLPILPDDPSKTTETRIQVPTEAYPAKRAHDSYDETSRQGLSEGPRRWPSVPLVDPTPPDLGAPLALSLPALKIKEPLAPRDSASSPRAATNAAPEPRRMPPARHQGPPMRAPGPPPRASSASPDEKLGDPALSALREALERASGAIIERILWEILPTVVERQSAKLIGPSLERIVETAVSRALKKT